MGVTYYVFYIIENELIRLSVGRGWNFINIYFQLIYLAPSPVMILFYFICSARIVLDERMKKKKQTIFIPLHLNECLVFSLYCMCADTGIYENTSN